MIEDYIFEVYTVYSYETLRTRLNDLKAEGFEVFQIIPVNPVPRSPVTHEIVVKVPFHGRR